MSITVNAGGILKGTNLSGTNSGDLTMGSVASSSSATGATIATQILTMTPCDGTNPGIVTAGTQTIAGKKTFTGTVYTGNATALSFINTSGVDTWNFSMGLVSTNVLTLSESTVAQRINIFTGGDIVIGGNTDNGYKLEVNGSVRIDTTLTVLGATSMAGNLTVSPGSAGAYKAIFQNSTTAAGATGIILYNSSGQSNSFAMGIAGNTNDFVNGSAANDGVLVTNGGNIRFGVGNSATVLALTATTTTLNSIPTINNTAIGKAVFQHSSSTAAATCVYFNNSTGQTNGLTVGIAGAANDFFTGTVANDSVFVGAGSNIYLRTNGVTGVALSSTAIGLPLPVSFKNNNAALSSYYAGGTTALTFAWGSNNANVTANVCKIGRRVTLQIPAFSYSVSANSTITAAVSSPYAPVIETSIVIEGLVNGTAVLFRMTATAAGNITISQLGAAINSSGTGTTGTTVAVSITYFASTD